MNIDEAVQTMSTSLDVDHWNERREFVKQVVGDNWFKGYMQAIDGSGLIIKILGNDKYKVELDK